jgi:hypothetical protein
MKLDFLALLESIVGGFVAFVHSVATSLWAILRRPVRGPLRLVGRWRRPGARQIGGVTFLYLGAFLSLYFTFRTWDFTGLALIGAAGEAIVTLPTISQAELWPILAGALVATTLIDAALRLWLRRRWRRQRRELLAAAAEYSLFLAAIPAAFAGWYMGAWRCPEIVGDLPALAWAAALLVPLGCWPAAAILGLPRHDGTAWRTLALALLLLAAGFAGVRTTLAIGAGDDVCWIP